MQKKILQTIIFIIFWDLLMFYLILLSPQVKRWAIITYKHGIHELPQELPNELRLRSLENYEKLKKCLNFTEWWPSTKSSCQNGNFINTSRKLLARRNETFPLVHYFTWKLEFVSDILWVIVFGNFFLILTPHRSLQT